MFNMGTSEIAVILVIAVLVIKPSEIPGLTRKAGKALGSFKRYKDAFTKEMNSLEELKDLDKPLKSEDNQDKEESKK